MEKCIILFTFAKRERRVDPLCAKGIENPLHRSIHSSLTHCIVTLNMLGNNITQILVATISSHALISLTALATI